MYVVMGHCFVRCLKTLEAFGMLIGSKNLRSSTSIKIVASNYVPACTDYVKNLTLRENIFKSRANMIVFGSYRSSKYVKKRNQKP